MVIPNNSIKIVKCETVYTLGWPVALFHRKDTSFIKFHEE
jgi:hypothetical protein